MSRLLVKCGIRIKGSRNIFKEYRWVIKYKELLFFILGML